MPAEACNAEPLLTDTQARLEAARCLLCEDPPCVAACPARVPVKHFIRAIRFDTPRRAINLIRDRNVFAGVCGVACPVDQLCVGACMSTQLTTPIAIGALQRYAAERELRAGRPGQPGPLTGKKVAVIGAGPSGLAAAAQLARLGHSPIVFEKNKRPGGILAYGVPRFRLSPELVAAEIEYIKSLGVEIRTSSRFGETSTIDDLFAAGYQAVYVAAGLEQAATPGIPGEDLPGVITWKDLLGACSGFGPGEGRRPAVSRRVIIVGGGSVAMDVASVAAHLGAEEIDMVCLEAPREMPAHRAALEEAWQRGVRFHTRSMPLKITGAAGGVTGLRAVRIRWKEPDSFVPENAQRIDGTEYWLPGATVILAIGARPATNLSRALPGVRLDQTGRVLVDSQTGATSRPGVFAGGDLTSGGGATIVKAVAEGNRSGQAIDAYLRQKSGGLWPASGNRGS